MAHKSPRLVKTLITSRAWNKVSEIFGVLVANARTVATRTAAVIVALRNGGAQVGALSIPLFPVEQLVKLASVCSNNHMSDAGECWLGCGAFGAWVYTRQY